jgi:hypothetical protein
MRALCLAHMYVLRCTHAFACAVCLCDTHRYLNAKKLKKKGKKGKATTGASAGDDDDVVSCRTLSCGCQPPHSQPTAALRVLRAMCMLLSTRRAAVSLSVLSLLPQELPSDRVAFGEVVHAPPEVALKSKHWAANAQQRQQQQQHGSGKKQKQQQPPKQQVSLCTLA